MPQNGPTSGWEAGIFIHLGYLSSFPKAVIPLLLWATPGAIQPLILSLPSVQAQQALREFESNSVPEGCLL